MNMWRLVVSPGLAGVLGISGHGLAADFPISSGATGEFDPDVSYDPGSNEFMTVWADSQNDIFAQRVATDGSLLGGNFVITSAVGDQRFPAVASKSGESLVVWLDHGTNIYAQRVASDGSLVGTSISIATLTWNSQRWPDVAYSGGDDAYLVVWDDNAGWDVYGSLVQGTTVGPIITISTANNNQTNPKVVYNSVNGSFSWCGRTSGMPPARPTSTRSG